MTVWQRQSGTGVNLGGPSNGQSWLEGSSLYRGWRHLTNGGLNIDHDNCLGTDYYGVLICQFALGGGISYLL